MEYRNLSVGFNSDTCAILCIFIWDKFREEMISHFAYHKIQNILCTCTSILNSFFFHQLFSFFPLLVVVVQFILFFRFTSFPVLQCITFLNNPCVWEYVFLFLGTQKYYILLMHSSSFLIFVCQSYIVFKKKEKTNKKTNILRIFLSTSKKTKCRTN